jgi:hypothetical protein
MRMIYSSSLPDQLQEIRRAVDWALGLCGFDSISTEAGTSEFTVRALFGCLFVLQERSFVVFEFQNWE